MVYWSKRVRGGIGTTFSIMHTILSTKHYLNVVLSTSFVLVTALMCLAIANRQVYAESTTGPTNGRIVTVYDDGVEKGFITKKTTLREALAEAGVPIDPKDRTEPNLDETLVAPSYQVNVYRARPVVVRDGVSTTKIITSYRTGKQIAKDAGLTLRDEDHASLHTTTDLMSTGAAEVLTINRATPVTIIFYGKTLEVYTFAKTVGELLSQKNITPAANDTLSLPLATSISAGMHIELWKNGEQTMTQDEEIAFEIQQIKDANRDKTYKQIQTPGVVGKKTVTYTITMQNGKEVKREVVSSVTTKEPVKQVEVIGVKGVYTTPSENQTLTWNFLISKGLTREQTAGVMGNLMQEHGFNTSGDGLAQWTGSRKAKLMAMPDPYSIQTQLDFLWYELSGPYAKVLTNLQAQTTVEGAVVVFQNQYERCGICVESRRVQFAYNILASH